MKIINKETGDIIVEVFGKDPKVVMELAKVAIYESGLDPEKLETELIMDADEKFEYGVKQAEITYPQIDRFIDISSESYLRTKLVANGISNIDKVILDGIKAHESKTLTNYISTLDETIREDVKMLIGITLRFEWVYLNKVNYDEASKSGADFELLEFPNI